MAAKKRRYQPSRAKLEQAVSEILDKAINADSNNAPKQLHLILTNEHPEWKLPQRRVAKYLKRLLKERNDPKYEEIDADLDEASIYSASSTSTWRTGGASIVSTPVEDTPAPKEDVKEPAAAPEPVKPVIKAAPKEEVVEAYADDNDKKAEPAFCEGLCIIS